MTYAEAVDAAIRELIAAGFTPEDARRDASLLARHALGWTAEQWLVHRHDAAPAGWPNTLAPIIRRRSGHEPIAYITGTREFYGRQFQVTPAVLIPRPETELIVEAALERLGTASRAVRGVAPRIADIGTGSGCLAITLAAECPSARIVATDISDRALAVARKNAAALGAEDRVEFRCGSLLAGPCGPLDCLVSNPPYIAEIDRDALPSEVRDYEPPEALFAGPDGLAVIREIVSVAAEALAPGGWLLMELGAGQDHDARRLIEAQAGMQDVGVLPDLQGIPRVLVGRRSPFAA